MGAYVMKIEQLNLPEYIAKKIKTKKIELIETKDGVLIKPIECPVEELRGFLKGSKFTTERYLEQKKEDKELEL